MVIFGPKPWVNPFGKMSIFRLFELLLFILQKGVFSFKTFVRDIFLAYTAKKKEVEKMARFGPKPWVNIEYHKRRFPRLYCLIKKKARMAIFEQKRWVNPYGKMSIFQLLELLFLQSKKAVFSFKNFVTEIIFAYIAKKKKKLKKWPFLDNSHGLTPLKKCQFFDFLNFFFLQP